MPEPTLRARLNYLSDRFFARGTVSFMLFLLVNSFIAVVQYSIVAEIFDTKQTPFMEIFSQGWLKIYNKKIDAPIDLITAISGTFIFSTLIGVLTANVNEIFARLRSGRSEIIENNHYVILGWSAYAPILLTELVEGLRTRPRSCVVVMGDQDVATMQHLMRGRLPKDHKTRIIYRRGSPIEQQDLALLHLHRSKAIIILRPPQDDPDAQVIKTLLAITSVRGKRQAPYHIVAEIYNTENVAAAKAAGHAEVEIIRVSDMVAKVIAHACRQSGMSIIYNELLGFGNQEFYFYAPRATVGRPFVEAMHMIHSGTLVGLIDRDNIPRLMPDMQRVITADDQLVVIAENGQSAQIVAALPPIPKVELPVVPASTPSDESMLILGYNKRTPIMLKQINNYAEQPVKVTVVTKFTENLAQSIAQLNLTQLECTIISADTTSVSVLEGLNIPRFHHVIVLAYTEHFSIQVADSLTLMTLLHLRQIWRDHGRTFTIVSEMMDVRNRSLAEVTEADDFVVSDRVVSMLMAQVALNKQLNQLFSEWLNVTGSEISLHPISMYVPIGVPTTFRQVIAAAAVRDHVVMGYRRGDDSQRASVNYGVELNPNKDTVHVFKDNDVLVVISR